MASLDPRTRMHYRAARARQIDVVSLWQRARETSREHDRWTPAVLADMLWSAGVRQVGFQDYVDYDFATLTRAERDTYMTHPVSNELSQRYDDPRHRSQFHNKITFNETFAPFLHREWMTITPDNADEFRDFVERHGTVIVKEPVGQAGSGVHRYRADAVTDWSTFHRGLLDRGELLAEEVITQHPDLAAFCPGTVNTTRVTTFFDGERTHILAMAQKFGRGQVSDQMSFGGFYSMLDDDGRAVGAGYDSHGNVHELHPDTGRRISDFTLPMLGEVKTFIDEVARVVPTVRYVGWDVVVTPAGPVLVEGNWAAGVYENKPSVTGIRTGHKPRYRAAIGF
ncbi:sugar-transfer associated ATP-grasp domain-containing protein [Microbacterium sp. UBA837]|uniref:sugar-transfer associated ATP-grasp domain-containing protein n=1 Tax=Microbacterium sp. UBA837 TaxID=1946956 RepID=UPI0025D21A2D|nr:sugar-transfer associated ATP-grasp domain-containing protein [Microbacterium sp. UBA837]